ncbi:MAG: gliding motility-associated C-terminal domain-containing protein [Flavobacterium sp.]
MDNITKRNLADRKTNNADGVVSLSQIKSEGLMFPNSFSEKMDFGRRNMKNEPIRKFVFLVVFLISILFSNAGFSQNCISNAGGDAIVCGSTTTLVGSVSGTVAASSPAWTFVSGPVTPVIASPNTLTTGITGMTVDGVYQFRLTQNCGVGVATDVVNITAHPRPASFTAGPDVTGICASVGTTPLAGVIPAGFTGVWTAYNIYEFQDQGITVNTNATFSSTTSATPTFSLTNKTAHPEDPAYVVTLTITSLDGICSYSDTAIVRFCPNPIVPINYSACYSSSGSIFADYSTSAPAVSSDSAGSSGTVANGTTISINVISQPAGANMTFNTVVVIGGRTRMYFNGATVPGVYTYTVTTTNCCGSTTSAPVTFTHNGIRPNLLNFQPAGHGTPEQLVLYSAGGTAGEVHCGIAGTSNPELFYFDIDPADPAATVTTVTSSGILPAGASTPIVTISGAGTMNRVASVNPGASGWRIGTYRFTVTASNGSCSQSNSYYIHISDNSRVPIAVNNVAVCYPGTGAISATINLPAIYQGVVNTSYFQNFDGNYNFAVVSKPAGSGTPTYTTTNLRSLTSATTVISNLTMAGDYVFSITAYNGNGAGPFLNQEYACSGINTLTANFTVHVENPVNSNAGSDQTIACAPPVTLLGNSPGTGTGLWTVVSSPAGTTPMFTSASNATTTVNGATLSGVYVFRWTVTSQFGSCTSSDDTTVTISNVKPSTPTVSTTVQPTCSVLTGSVTLTNLPSSGTWTISQGGPVITTYTGTGTSYTISGLVPGMYDFLVIVGGSCSSNKTAPVIIDAATGCPTDLSVTKVVNNASPNVGSNVTFTITATNNGPIAATGVSVADNIPSGYTVVSVTPSTGTWTAPNWSIGNLANGSSATLTVVATVNATGSYANTATITGNQTDPNTTNNTSTSTPTPVPVTDLAVVKTVNNASPNVGSNVTFTITATNNGLSAATGVSVADNIPSGYTVVSVTPSTGTWTAPNWSIGNLANGASATLTVVATLNATGSYANTATITGNQTDPNTTNNTSTSTPTPVPVTDLAVVKTVNNASPNVGSNVTFTITATNNGPSAATGVSVADNIPSGYTVVSVTPSTGTWTAPNWSIGNLANGASATLTVVVTVNATGSYANTATITGNQTDPNTTNNTSTSTPTPGAVTDLAVTKVVNNASPNVGSNVTFTITATNNGLSAATGVSVADNIPSGYTVVSVTPSTGTWTAPNWSIGNLANGASATLTVVATLNATGSYANTATITGNQTDPNTTNNTSTSTPTPVPVTDLAVVKTVNNASPNVGSNVTFTITATNNGPSAATGVSVADNIPSGYTVVSVTPSTGTWTAPNWSIGNLANGASATLTVVATVNATGSYANTATITGNQTDPTPGNNTSTSTPTPVPVTDLAVVKTVNNASPNVGSNVTFTITATNNGPSAATGVSVADNIPSGYTVVSVTPSTGTWTAPNWSIGNLANGASATLTVVATVNATGSYANTATITGNQTDPTPGNNTSTSTPTPVPVTDLAITKVVNNASPNVGSNVTFMITATNNGPSAATGVSVADNIPSGYTVVSVTPSTGTWTAPNWSIGNLANGASATLTVVATVNATGSYANTATITGNQTDPTPGNNTSTSTPTPVPVTDLAITKVVNNASPNVGSNVTFMITATNNGPSAATGVSVADNIPSGYTVVSVTPSTGTWTAPNWSIGNLANGASATLTVVATVNATGSYANTATITGNQTDPNTTNNTSTSTPTPGAVTDLAVVKTVNNASPNVGSNVTFTITATNNGPSAATGVSVADNIPSGYSVVSVTPSTGTWTAPNWSIGNLANGASATLTVVATVNATGSYANTATITGNQTDLTPGNNTSTSTPTPVPVTDLAVVKTVNNASPNVGSNVTFTITATNNGPSAATGVSVADNIPSGYTVVSVTPSTGTWTAPNWSIGNLANGASATLTVVATVNATGSYVNTATITGNQTDPTPGNNSDTETPTPINVIDAVADSNTAPVNGITGGDSGINIFDNDTLNGTLLNPSDVTLTSTPNGPLTVNPNGTVSVAPNTPAGTYTVDYTICEILNPSNCDTTTVTITVGTPVIDAVADSNTAPVNGITGGDSGINIFDNDTLNGTLLNPSDVTLTSTPNGPLTVNPNGTVSVAPNTPAGTYTVDYTICEILNPSNCDTTTVTITVGTPVIDAVADSNTAPVNGITGGDSGINIFDNDTLNGTLLNPSDVTLTSTPNGPLTVNPNGTVSVAPNTPAGTYTVDYTICEILNPSNCDTTTVTITVGTPVIDAVADSNPVPVNGITGGDSGINIFDNDTLNGTAVNPSDVTLTSTPNGPLTVNPNGTVSVAPNTPAGTYTVDYTICEILNPSNCDTTTVTITVGTPIIDAVADSNSTPVNGITGGDSGINIFDNDTLNGTLVNPSDVMLTSTPNGPLTVNPNGTVSVAPNTPAGTYTVDYTICEILNPSNCDTTTVTITVGTPVIDAVADSNPTPVNGITGGDSGINIFDNDTLNGAPVNPSDVTLTSTPNGPLTVNPNGTVSVAPNTPAGTYTVDYTICEILNPSNCDTTTVTITVGTPIIDAVADSNTAPVNGITGGDSGINIFDNDTLNGTLVNPSDVMLTSTPNGPLTVNPNGTVSVAPNTPSGTYTVDYTICEILNPSNCDTTTVTITVGTPVIDAVADSNPVPVNGITGGDSGINIFDNDTLNGTAVNPSDVTLTSTPNGPLTVNPNGTVSVAPNTSAGTYTVDYTICEILNPSNCDTTTVTITVGTPIIDAVADSNPTPVNGITGGDSGINIFDNDTLNGTLVNPSDVTLTSTPNGPLTVNPNGTVSVAPNTPAGTYTVDYTICEILNPSNCDTTTVTITVGTPIIDAVADSNPTPVNGITGGDSGINIFDNDTLNGTLVNPSDVTLTSTPNGPLTVNPNGTVSVAPNTPAGTYTVDYTICEILNPSNCDTTTVTVIVVASPIIANDDTGNLVDNINGGISFSNVLGNDTLNGVAVSTTQVIITQISSTNAGVSLVGNDVIVAPGTPVGNYILTYQICEVLNPANCDTATVTVPVGCSVVPQPILACYETAVFNSTTCQWDVTGMQPTQPTPVNCWDNYQFDTTSCAWVNNGTQPTQPTPVNCWDNYQFDTTSCTWVNNGTQPTQPTPVNCWDNYQFDTTSCAWVNNGTQPTQPTPVNCWDNYQFDMTSCAWVNNGTQPTQPTPVNCWDSYQFDTTSCAWVNNGTQPTQPTSVNCWDNYQFDTTSCAWVNNGTQPTQPTSVNCWDNYQFDTTSCAWVNNGTQPTQPTPVNCWDNYQFDTTSCAWVNNGTQPTQPTPVNCWDNYQFDTTSCAWVNNGTQPTQPQISVITQPTCTQANGSFTILNYNAAFTYVVTPSTGVIINGAVVTAPSGTYQLSALNGTCSSVITVVTIDAQPQGETIDTIPVETCNGEEFSPIDLATLLPEGTPSGGTWVDVDGIGGLNGTVFSGFGIPTGVYTYRYEYNDGSECNAGVDVLITISEICPVLPCQNIIIHNAFTPNGDGLNEFFFIENIDRNTCYANNTVEVYNRWGVLVYETKDYDNNTRKFVGISEGRVTINKDKELPDGTYFYIINWTTTEQERGSKAGYLFLKR